MVWGAAMTKQRGTFRYPGSKTLIRRWIIDQFPEHHLYVEPFGGAASILVGKDRSKVEVYNDTNSDCVTFFRAVREKGEELAEWVDKHPYSREEFERYCKSYPDWPDDIVEHAGRFLFVQSANFGGKVIGQESPSFSVTKVGERPDACNSKIWHRKPPDIEWLQERFKGVQIEHRDFEDVINRYDDPQTLFYCDPPYVDVGDGYYENEEGGFDHERFIDTVQDIDGKCLISYDHNIPDGLEEWHHIDRTKIATMSYEKPEKVESLTMNYDPKQVAKFSETNQQGLGAFE